jgi:hypothetical protein
MMRGRWVSFVVVLTVSPAVASCQSNSKAVTVVGPSTTAEPVTTTSQPVTTLATTTAPLTTTTTQAPIGRDTRLALTVCGRQAGSTGLGLDVGAGATKSLTEAQASCQKALDLLAVDSKGVPGPTLINRMSLLISKRMVTMAEAAVGLAVNGKASDYLLSTAGDWSDEFTAYMRLLP